jgi:hypothetical protein
MDRVPMRELNQDTAGVLAFVTYDERLAEAARGCSFTVVAPGADPGGA